MFNFIAGVIVLILSYIVGMFEHDHSIAGGAAKTPQFATTTRWFDPKTFVTEMPNWWIGAGLEPSSWERVDPKRWPSQVQLHDRDGLTVENERHRMQWCDWQKLPASTDKGADYLRSWHADQAAIKGENAFLMTPYLREWQRINLWPHVAEHARLFDIGVGTGRSRDLWQAKRLHVWGVEPNRESVAQLERRRIRGVEVRPWGGEAAEIRDWIPAQSVDLVMMSYSITFFFHSEERLAALVQNIKHALRPGGHFLLIGMDGAHVEQWFQAAKTDRLDNALFTISHPKKFKERVFGREIEITMKNPNTLVEAQREYLVDFTHFRKVLAKAGLKCTVDRHVAAPEWMGEWPRRFVEAQRFLVFSA